MEILFKAICIGHLISLKSLKFHKENMLSQMKQMQFVVSSSLIFLVYINNTTHNVR